MQLGCIYLEAIWEANKALHKTTEVVTHTNDISKSANSYTTTIKQVCALIATMQIVISQPRIFRLSKVDSFFPISHFLDFEAGGHCSLLIMQM